MSDTNMTVADIIKGAHESKPADVETAFNNVIADKMAAAIEARRQEIASSIYGSSEDDVEVDPDAAEQDLETETED